MDQSRYIATHVAGLPKSGIRDFFDIVARMKDAISLGLVSQTLTLRGIFVKREFTPLRKVKRITPRIWG